MTGEGDQVIRDKEHRIIAWCIGMSDEDIEQFLQKYPNSYRSVAYYDEKEGGLR